MFGLCCAVSAYAYDIKVDGIYYNILSLTDLTCEVTYGDEEYTDTVVIPSTISYNNRTLDVIGVGESAFASDGSLKSVELPNSVTKLGNYVFTNCEKIREIVIPNSVTEMGGSIFSNCGKLENVTLSTSLKSIPGGAFSSCGSLTSIVIPNSVTTIGEYAFSDSNLNSIIIPEYVESINNNAFGYCKNLEYATLNENLEIIGSNCFNGCENLKSIVIPDKVEKLESWTFYNCHSLTTVTLGKKIGIIEDSAFRDCPALAEINVLAPIPPEIQNGNFSNSNYMDAVVNVPAESLETYRNDDSWKNFWNIMGKDFSSGVTVNPIKGRCAAPSLSMNGYNIVATCSTANAQVRVIVNPDDAGSETISAGESISMNGQYQITAYAEAPDHLASELVFATLVWINPTLSSGLENVTMPDHKAVMIQASEGEIRIYGTESGQTVSVYTIDGRTIYSGKAAADETVIPYDGILKGIAIVKYAEKTVKIRIN